MRPNFNIDDSHTKYYNTHGIEVPSATTILKLLNKPQLVKWANYLGFNSLNVDSVLNEASTLGTHIHNLINAILNNYYIIYINREELPSDVVYSYINRFKQWLNINTLEPILLEKSITSDKFGGTLDCYGILNGKYTIIDFKTSKKIYLTMFFQLALYTILLEEKGYPVEQVGILLVNPKITSNNEKYIDREKLQPYIDFVKKLVDLFHDYDFINKSDKWNNNIV